MEARNRKKISGTTLALIYFASLLALIVVRNWTVSLLPPAQQSSIPVLRPPEMQPGTSFPAPSSKNISEVPLIRKSRVLRGSDLIENIFFSQEKEIARQRVACGVVVSQNGTIPDGKVLFFDQYNNTHGEEYYRDGKLHGPMKAYYHSGTVQGRAYYVNGELQTIKEYYNNGKLRFEADYTDARPSPVKGESGIGKVYFDNGRLKYEWYFTNHENTGHRKSYDEDGRVRFEALYDRAGNVISKKKGR